MKKYPFFAGLGLSLFLLGNLSMAQTVSTPIVGFQKTTLNANSYKGIGIPLLNPAVITGSVSSKSGYVVAISGASALGDSLQAAPSAYYLEVTSPANSPNIGDRLEVDVAATKTANNGTVVLATSPRNTANATSASLASGTGVVVRKHVTLDQFRASLGGNLRGDDNSLASADVVYMHNGVGFMPFWLGSDLQSWYSNDDPDDHRYDVVAPGQGVLFFKRGAATTFTSTGAVRANDFKQALPAGYQMGAPGYPVSYTPVQLGGALNNGWVANDKIYTHNGIGFTAYTLINDGSSEGAWDDGENPDPANNTVIVNGDTSFLTYLSSPVTDVETKPVQ